MHIHRWIHGLSMWAQRRVGEKVRWLFLQGFESVRLCLVPCCVQSSWRWKTAAERERASLVVTMSCFETMASPWPELYLDLFQHSRICSVVLDIFWVTLEPSFSVPLHAAMVSAVVWSGHSFKLLTSSEHTSLGEELIYQLWRVPLCPSRWRYMPPFCLLVLTFSSWPVRSQTRPSTRSTSLVTVYMSSSNHILASACFLATSLCHLFCWPHSFQLLRGSWGWELCICKEHRGWCIHCQKHYLSWRD